MSIKDDSKKDTVKTKSKDADLLKKLRNKRDLAKKQNKAYHARIKKDRKYYDCEVDGSKDYPLGNVAANFIIDSYVAAGEDLHLTDENPENLEWLFISNAVLKDAETKYGLQRIRRKMYVDFVSAGPGYIKVVTEVKTSKKDLSTLDKFKGIVGLKKEEDEVVDDTKVHVESVDPLNMFVMNDAGEELEDSCTFEKIYKSPEEIERKYGVKIDKDDILTLATGDKDLDEGLSVGEKEAGRKVKLWICWSPYALGGKEQKGSYYLFSEHKVFKNNAMKYNPYTLFLNHRYADREKELQPYGDIRLIRPLVEYLNEVKQDIRRYVRRVARSKWEVLKGAKVDVNALRNPKSGVVVEVSQMGNIKALEVPQLNPAVLQYANDLERFVQMISGMIGGDQTIQGVTTATGQGIMAAQSGKKIGGGFDSIATGMERVYRLILWNIYQNYTEGQLIEVVGEDLVEKFKESEANFRGMEVLTPDPTEFQNPSIQQAVSQTGINPMEKPPFEVLGDSSDGKGIMVQLQENALVESPKIRVTILPEQNKEIRLKRAIELYGLALKDPMTDSSEVMKVVARMMDVGVDPEKFVVSKEDMMQEQAVANTQAGAGATPGVPALGGGAGTEGALSEQAAAL